MLMGEIELSTTRYELGIELQWQWPCLCDCGTDCLRQFIREMIRNALGPNWAHDFATSVLNGPPEQGLTLALMQRYQDRLHAEAEEHQIAREIVRDITRGGNPA